MAEHNQRFSSEKEWINKATSWLTRHRHYSAYFKAICFDSTGKICKNGGDFSKAQYPVHWIWPDQNIFDEMAKINAEKNIGIVVSGTEGITFDDAPGDLRVIDFEKPVWINIKGFTPTHRHKKRGIEYQVLGEATLQYPDERLDEMTLVLYKDAAGKYWVRTPHEFYDGRFEEIAADATNEENSDATN